MTMSWWTVDCHAGTVTEGFVSRTKKGLTKVTHPPESSVKRKTTHLHVDIIEPQSEEARRSLCTEVFFSASQLSLVFRSLNNFGGLLPLNRSFSDESRTHLKARYDIAVSAKRTTFYRCHSVVKGSLQEDRPKVLVVPGIEPEPESVSDELEGYRLPTTPQLFEYPEITRKLAVRHLFASEDETNKDAAIRLMSDASEEALYVARVAVLTQADATFDWCYLRGTPKQILWATMIRRTFAYALPQFERKAPALKLFNRVDEDFRAEVAQAFKVQESKLTAALHKAEMHYNRPPRQEWFVSLLDELKYADDAGQWITKRFGLFKWLHERRALRTASRKEPF